MSDKALLISIVILPILFIVGVAYALQRLGNHAKSKNINTTIDEAASPKVGIYWWTMRVLFILIALSIVCGFIFNSLTFIWITLGLCIVLVIIGSIWRYYRLFTKIIGKEKSAE